MDAIKFNTLILSIAIILIGCGRPTTSNPQDKNSLFLSPIIEGGSPFEDSEQGVAYRVCFALRAKRFHYQNLDGSHQSKSLSFTNSIKNCEQTIIHKEDIELNFSKDGDLLEYQYQNSNKLFYGPLTDKQGLLGPVCEKVLKGEISTNVFTKNNQAYEVSFFSQMNTDGVLIKFGEENPENEFQYLPIMAHYYYVLTDTTVSGDMLGIIYKAEEVKSCENGSQIVETISSKDL